MWFLTFMEDEKVRFYIQALLKNVNIKETPDNIKI